MRKKILIVDDDELLLESIKTALEKKNYEVLTAGNGEIALEVYKSYPVHLVITDIRMPVMDGVELIKNLLLFQNKPIIIAQSVQTDMNLIIELMQNGVYDYLLKPFNFPELVLRVDKAYEAAELRILKENLEKEREVRVSHMLNWNEWKESIIKRDQDKMDGDLIGSIRTSFSQGIGIGNLLSAISIVEKKAKEKENYYEVNKPLMKFLFENAKNAARVIDVLEEIDKIQTSELELKEYSISELHKIVNSVVVEMENYNKLRNHSIVLCENKFIQFPHRLKLNSDYTQKAMREIIFNALKFSKENTKIYIIMEVKSKSILISILNTPENIGGVYGILPEYSNIIFEPFFRISKLVFESFPTLDFGLGLTMVDKIFRKHNGKIRANNLLSYLNMDDKGAPGILVNFEIEIPFVD